MKYIQTLTEKGKLKWQDSDAPDANGRFKDLSPKDLAAWLIKTRKGDMKKISGSLSQQVAFNKNDDPEYAKKMDKTRTEVYKQMDREDLLESVDTDDLKTAKEYLLNPHTILDITYGKTRRGDKFVRFDYENKYVPGKMLDSGPHFVKVFYDNDRDLKKISKELNMDLKESVLNEEDSYNDYPAAAKKNAQMAIDWKEKYGRDEVPAGTPVGWARAHQLAKGEKISADTVKRMSAFNRHRKNSSIAPEHKDEPWKDNGYVAWLIWGGDEGVDWAIEKSKEIDAMKESKQMKYIKPLNERAKHTSTDFSKPGNDGDIYFSKREGDAVGVRLGDKLQMIYVFQEEPKLGRIQKSDKRWENMGPASEELLIDLRGREEGKILFKFVSTLEESVNEGKMPKKYIGNDEIVYLKTKEDSRGAHYNLYYKGHDIDKGGRRFGSEKELEDFAANYILSNQLYKKLRYEDSIPLPESIEEAKLSKIHNATKKGSYPVSLVVIENGKVVKQELVGTPQIVPAAFNQLKKEYPNATVHVEDRTGKRLFSESVTEGMSNERQHIKSINEGYWSGYDYDKWTKENGKPKYPKWVKVTLKEIVKGGFMDSVYDSEHMYMVLWLGSFDNQRRSELSAYDKKGIKEFGKVGYKLVRDKWNDLTGYNMFFMMGAMYALEVSKQIQDKIANGEPVEPAYYLMKEYFNNFGMDIKRSRIFNAAYEKLEKWMKDNNIKAL